MLCLLRTLIAYRCDYRAIHSRLECHAALPLSTSLEVWTGLGGRETRCTSQERSFRFVLLHSGADLRTRRLRSTINRCRQEMYSQTVRQRTVPKR